MPQGARQQGIKEHVKVKKKHDVTGVGAVSVPQHNTACTAVCKSTVACLICSSALQLEAVAKARDWTAGMAAYDLVLAKMKPMSTVSDDATRQSEPKVKSKKRKQPEATEEVVTVAAAPLPAKDKSSKKKTKKPKQQLNTAVITETPLSSPAAKMSKPKATVTAAATKVVPAAIAAAQQAKGRHVGRYHRVTAAKKAKGYSSSDLAAILGVEPMPAAVSAAATASPSSAQVFHATMHTDLCLCCTCTALGMSGLLPGCMKTTLKSFLCIQYAHTSSKLCTGHLCVQLQCRPFSLSNTVVIDILSV